MSIQLPINATKNNKDGTGIFSSKFLWRNDVPAYECNKIIKTCYEVAQKTEPLLGHVRFASIPKKLGKENTHPFNGKKYILAHNGTLEFSAEDEKRLNGTIDSEKFLFLLEEIEEQNPNLPFPELIKKATDLVTGKFAFLIVDKNDNNFYVVRGKQAELWETHNENGYIVNTDKESLLFGLNLFMQASYSQNMKYLNSFSVPTLLKENSVFLVKENELEIVGEVKEAVKIHPVTVYYQGKYQNINDDYDDWWKSRKNPVSTAIIHPEVNNEVRNYKNIVHTIYQNLMFKGGMDFEEIDILINKLFGFPLTGIEKEYLPALFNAITKLKSYITKEKTQIWTDILYFASENDPEDIYKEYNLQFPFFLNDIEILNEVHKEVEETFNAFYGIMQ